MPRRRSPTSTPSTRVRPARRGTARPPASGHHDDRSDMGTRTLPCRGARLIATHGSGAPFGTRRGRDACYVAARAYPRNSTAAPGPSARNRDPVKPPSAILNALRQLGQASRCSRASRASAGGARFAASRANLAASPGTSRRRGTPTAAVDRGVRALEQPRVLAVCDPEGGDRPRRACVPPAAHRPDRAGPPLEGEQDVRDDLGDLAPLDLLAHGGSRSAMASIPLPPGAVGGGRDLVV